MNTDIFCESTGGNTGMPNCGVIPGKLTDLFFIRTATTLTLADLADLETTLKEKCALEDLDTRFYPIHGVDEDEDTSEDATLSTSSRGYVEKTDKGSIQYTLNYHLDLCRAKQLAQWDGFSGYCFFADDNGNFWGKRNEDGTLSALKLSNVVANPKLIKTGADIVWNAMIINLGAPTKIFWSTVDIEKYDFDMADIAGIQTLKIRKVGTGASTFSAELSCGGGSIYNQYKAVISAIPSSPAPPAWTATNAATGADIEIASIAENDGVQGYDLTFTTPPVVGTKVTIALDLSALTGIDGYEVKSLTYTV
jgi:hypothetical protein